MKDDLSLIPRAAKLGPMGVVHYEGVTDQRFRAGEHAKVQEFLKRVRDSGVMVGMSSHLPENIAYARERGWDVDFYMTCFHQLSRWRSPELDGSRTVDRTGNDSPPVFVRGYAFSNTVFARTAWVNRTPFRSSCQSCPSLTPGGSGSGPVCDGANRGMTRMLGPKDDSMPQ